MTRRYPREKAGPDGWTDWVTPIPFGYRMACCDCSLVHEMEFRVVLTHSPMPDGGFRVEPIDGKKFRAQFRVKRNNRATAAMRRGKR